MSNESKGRHSNKGQGHKGGTINTPGNIPDDSRGTRHGSDVKSKLDRVHNDPAKHTEAGLGGTYSGSNKSIVS